MSGDELSRKDQRVLDGIALTGDAHDAGKLEAFEEIFRRATSPDATIPGLVDDLQQRIDEIRARRAETS
jgi:hypothetical protein